MEKTIFIIFIFFVFSSFSCYATDPFSEALLSLKSELIIPSKDVLNDWIIPKNQTPSSKIIACSWTGIKCDQNMSKITSLDLSFKNLGGVLSLNQFGQFLDLIDLNISHNSFSDQIPVGIFNLTSLKTLDISRNNFSGVFPSGISNLENLVVFDAFSNSFSGSLPKDVCEIWSLKVLNFAGSYFSGSIPSEYGYCKSLEFLHLGGNFLTGNLPKEFGQLKNIVHMEIGYNMYEGGIPWEFGNMSELQYLDIADANLSGSIPKELGNLTKLDTLFLFKNHLSGMLPAEFGDILTLLSLDVSDNMLTGPIPESFSNLKNLKLLSVMYNDMNGSVPDGIAKLPNLESLLIWDNFFSGVLPQELGKHSKLKWVDVSTNDFVGVIPPDICSGGELSRLMLFSNYFSGGLSSISNCSSLVRVRLEDNLFSGGIPFDIFHATNLEHFNVSSNPNLGGILPEKIWSLPVLQNFSAIFCNISGIVPGFQSCKSLYVIELNGNHLSGTIPESLSVCENLGMLNLAENNLSGEIPVKLGSSTKWKFLNLSYNDLSGSIPMENSFKAMDSSSFLGNPNLCGAPLARPCHHGNAISEGMELGSRRSHKVAWVIVLCAVVVLLVCFLLGIVYYRRQNVNRHWRMVSFGGLPELTAADVLKSFDSVEAVETPYSSNSVCKAVLLTGMTVIVRKIEWGAKSSNLLMDFINRLGNSQHKNLIRLLGFCYNKNLGYLLYEYLPNGNLDEKIGVKRDWGSKHRLVVNIAKGLCFLHHDCRPAIPHGNLKASNIVFDENMEPHLAEFAFKTISAMETGEYKGLMEHELTDDIFDFGEVVLEILTNCKRKNGGMIIHRTPREVLLTEIYQANEVASSSSSKSVQEEIKLVFEVVLRCTTSKHTDRPSMEEVLKILSGLKPERK